jgi:hypothetical protein
VACSCPFAPLRHSSCLHCARGLTLAFAHTSLDDLTEVSSCFLCSRERCLGPERALWIKKAVALYEERNSEYEVGGHGTGIEATASAGARRTRPGRAADRCRTHVASWLLVVPWRAAGITRRPRTRSPWGFSSGRLRSSASDPWSRSPAHTHYAGQPLCVSRPLGRCGRRRYCLGRTTRRLSSGFRRRPCPNVHYAS